MKKIFFALVLMGSVNAVLADSLVCTAGSSGPPVVVPCSSVPINIAVQFPALSISGNTITTTATGDLTLLGGPANEFYSASVAVNDRFAIPASPAGDLFNVSVSYGAGQTAAPPGSNVSFSFQIGPGSASSPEIDLNPDRQPPAYCPPGSPQSCIYTGTLPASAYSFLAIQGAATLVPNDNGSGGGGVQFNGNFDISRFKADGVTPDPFTVTPEPATYALGLTGFLLWGTLVRRRR